MSVQSLSDIAIDELIKQINPESPQLLQILETLKSRERELPARGEYYSSLFPVEQAMIILSNGFSNKIKVLILYFLGFFARYSNFNIKTFENLATISVFFGLFNQSSLITKQIYHVLQNLTSNSIAISHILAENHILEKSFEEKPYFRIIDTVLNVISLDNFEITEEILTALNNFITTYLNAGNKEKAGALRLASYLQSKNLYDYSGLNIHQYICSQDKDLASSACELVLELENPSFTYLPEIIDATTKSFVPFETTFEILLKNHDSWSGYNKDIVFEFIRFNIIDGTYDESKLATKLYLLYCDSENEWDYEIISHIIKFCDEKEMAIEIFQCIIKYSELVKAGNDLEGFAEILEEISIFIDDHMTSDNETLAFLANTLSQLTP